VRYIQNWRRLRPRRHPVCLHDGSRGLTYLLPYPSLHWLKVKNPNAPAVTREAEEDWGAKSGT
jgi:hypothetical protein